ncbi:hypothetical protein Tco_0950698, partial [Tanacetum coccineum]
MQRSYSTLNVFVYKGRVHRIVRKQDNEGRSPYGAAIFQIVGILMSSQTPLLQPKVFETPGLNIHP